MDRARRAEPYSNATIWTREIARNLAGHLDRLSKVHSCVDSASPKWAHHSTHGRHGSQPLKRVGQVSPLKHDRTSAPAQSTPSEERDEHAVSPKLLHEDYITARDNADEAAVSRTPTRQRRAKALKKIQSVAKRELHEGGDHHADTAHENQRPGDPGSASASGHYEYLESYIPAPTHSKKGPSLDYHRRQEQQRIWQENQALAKRLRNTKPTLNSKDWEKDDKWNQSFLKTQERRRQALHDEMARSLATPHSAMIRVKHVVLPPAHTTGRPYTEHGHVEDGTAPVTAIEVTAQDTKPSTSGRDLRRRRSLDEEFSRANRHCQSTAPNHRRIMELRKQKERSDPRPHPVRAMGATQEAATDSGPPDELVSVRFTFSREGNRSPCTPNGITGQFSPAVGLEAALEASCQDDDLLVDLVPTLEPPHTSRLDPENEHEHTSDAVFSVLLSCIDDVVAIAEQSARAEEEPASTAVGHVEDVDAQVQHEPEETEALAPEANQKVEELLVARPHEPEVGTDASEDPEDRPSDIPPAIELHATDTSAADEATPQKDVEVVGFDVPLATEPVEPAMVSPRDETPRHEMDASAYGSEFDGEDVDVTASEQPPAELRPSLASDEPAQPEPHQQDEDDNEQYEDDHDHTDDVDDDNEATDEPQYHDDLEKDDEQSYGDDDFADDN